MRPFSRFAALAILLSSLAWASPASAGGGCHTEEISDSGGTEVLMAKNCFSPTVLRVAPGATVHWKNFDYAEHTVTSAGMFIDQTLGASGAFDFRFDKAGVYPYYCTIHPGMAGAVVVGDPPAAVAAAPVKDSNPVAATRTEDSVPGAAVAAIGVLAAGGGFGLGLLRRRTESTPGA
jgi:plastocyanin